MRLWKMTREVEDGIQGGAARRPTNGGDWGVEAEML